MKPEHMTPAELERHVFRHVGRGPTLTMAQSHADNDDLLAEGETIRDHINDLEQMLAEAEAEISELKEEVAALEAELGDARADAEGRE